jgi:hypothetical protein
MEFILFLLLALVAGGAGVYYGFKGIVLAVTGKASIKGFFQWLLLEIVLFSTALFGVFMTVVSLF